MKPQYVVDKDGNPISVILPIKEYNKMLADIEELEDIRLYDEVKAKKDKTIPFEEYLQQRKKANG